MITKTYTIHGMTCEGCKASVTQKLSELQGVGEVTVDLVEGEAHITSNAPLNVVELQRALPSTYAVLEQHRTIGAIAKEDGPPSKWKQL
ncbi:MAG: heavy-metal-associated domain-containing protein, partial [Flavobacteriaceae bacterium]